MDITVYKLLHLLGFMAVMLALGSGLGAESGKTKWMAPVHGVGLLLMLVAGFGMLARLGTMSGGAGMPLWVIVKLIVWLVMGAMLVLVKRKRLPAAAILALLFILGGTAASMAIWKP